MKKSTLLFLALSIMCSAVFAQNGNHQPYCDYWFPATLLNWTPASDSASPFNKGRVPLATRFIDTLSSPCPVSKNPNVKLSCLSVTYAHTSGNPSQGYDHAGEYAFGFWQYSDYFIMWGGSAGEGLILAPNSTWINAGHRNGVKVMGTIFFPPNVYGGTQQFVSDLVQTNSSGNYIVADKLIEMANYYGFDGFFLNEETSVNSATGTAMEGFLAYFQAHKPANMEIMWYDAMVPSGAVSYQNALNTANAPLFQNGSTLESNTIFLNYNWNNMTASHNEAVTLGRNPFDVHAGVDVSVNGYNSNLPWSGIFPTVSTPRVSLGLFEPSWTFHGMTDPTNIQLFQQREQQFWVGANGSPCNVPTSGWPGLSKYYIEKSVINSWPFVTHFNTGQGNNGFWIDGNLVSTKPWNNMDDQDILPTWRWVSQSSGTPLSVNWDFTKAYNGGNSLKITGALSSSNTTTVKLYNTQLPVSASSNVSITYELGSVGASNMSVAVAFTDAPTTFYYLPCPSTTSVGWNSTTLSLSAYAGKTLCVLGLQFASATAISSYAMNIGEIKLTNGTAGAPAAPTNVIITNYNTCTDAELKVYYDTSASNNVWYYDIYRVTPAGDKQFLGRTIDNAYYVKNIKRIDNESTTQIEVVAVSTDGQNSAPAVQTITWPANPTNYAVSLNGTSKDLNAGIINLDGGAITMEGWVNATAFNTTSPNISGIMGIDDTMSNTAMLRLNNNKAEFSLNVGGTIKTLTSTSTLTSGSWYHLAGVYDGTNMTLYINDTSDATMAASGSIKAQGHFFIGRDSVAQSASYLNGMLDELRVWSVARAQTDLASANCQLSDTTVGLTARWTFNDCVVGTVAYDNSNNSHDATALGMTAADWVTTVPCAADTATGIAEIVNNQVVKFYPNPLINSSTATLEIPDNMKAIYAIYDATGNMILTQSTDQKMTNINTERLSAGIYLYRVVCNNQSFMGKFVVLKD